MNTRRLRTIGVGTVAALTLAAAGLLLPALSSAASSAAVSLGTEYRTGDYGLGGADIDDVYVPLTVELQSDDLVFRATVPYAWVEGPEGSLLVSDTVLPGEGPEVSEGGLGDVIASVTVQDVYLNPAGDVAVDLTGTVKLGTADEDKGLGTGEADYSAQVDVYRFLDGGTAFASLGYKVRGEPSGLDLKNTWFVSVGGAARLSDTTSLGGAFGYRPEVVSSGDPASEATVFLSQQLTDAVQLRGHVLLGLADGSPDWGAGATLRWRM